MIDTVTRLDRAPSSVRRIAYRIASGQGLLGRWADSLRFRFTDGDIPAVPETRTEDVRLLIGPANSAGQGFRWARAAESGLEGVAATAMRGIGADPFMPEVDLRVPVAVYQRSEVWHDAFEAYLARQTHLVWESGLPLLGRRFGADVAREIDFFRARGVSAALLFHGSDIRPPARHAATSPWSPFREPAGPVHALEEMAARNAALASAAGSPVFVSTPDLLQWLPSATWCPVVVDPAPWQAAVRARPASARPVVAHAPSQRWLKGTDRIEPILRKLDGEGVIEYRRIVGVAHASMPAFYAGADIVLDQFALGSYGVAACEALASGRLVMSHVDNFTRAAVRQRTGWEIPVHETTIDTLEGELRRAAAEPEAFDVLRERGPRFVEAVHDGRRSASALAPYLGVSA